MELKRRLPHTYGAFLGRFPKPTDIQNEAIPAILDGHNVLLTAPTASGKSEGYAAPLVERYFAELKKGQARLLILCPTRALVNDLARRLSHPVERCGLRLLRRTGDHTNSLENPADVVVVTTPESLDSLLSRHPRWLGNVRAVVLDELHALASNTRGSQVLLLLERLDRVCLALGGQKPQRVAASATVGRAGELAEAYLGEKAVIVTGPKASSRPVDYREALCQQPSDVLAALGRHPKVLCFVPSRQDSETYVAALRGKPPYRDAVYAHHASLSKPERERVEKAFLTAPSGLIFATPTLELGIDVGDVDLVCLLGAPKDVGSFLQRSGRANRRKVGSQVLGLYRDPSEQVRLRQLCDLAFAGDLREEPLHFFSSVILQQAFSLLFQNPQRLVTSTAVWDRLPPVARRGRTVEDMEELLEHASERGWLQFSQNAYRATDKLENLFQRAQLHGNFQSDNEKRSVTVKDAVTQRTIGSIQVGGEGKIPQQLSLGGRKLQLRGSGKEAYAVEGVGSSEGDANPFAGGGTPNIGRLLSSDLGFRLGLPRGCWLHVGDGDRHYLAHFWGTLWGEALEGTFSSWNSNAKVEGNAFVLRWLGKSPPLWPELRERLEQSVERRALKLARLAGCGRWTPELPASWLQREVAVLLDIPPADGPQIVSCPPELQQAIQDFAPAWGN